ncbi:MAG: bifunctional oligoribonuclease/PAP phosphatase NrnA, partial [Clostridia bacterium]|nr:bifunctional oligoribonuclease/PAP phosphatase NrnA [Clostridia bacterium]
SVLCEIRSNKYNINPIAVKYSGGGHKKASGATLKSKNEAMMLLSDLNALDCDE